MTIFSGATRALRTVVVVMAMSILATGCGSKLSSQQDGSASATGAVNITPTVLLDSINKAIQQPVARALGGWEWGGFLSSFGTLLSRINFNNTLDMQKVAYQSIGADGQPHTMTGLLILPRSLSGSKPSVPILMFQHGTEPYRQYSPSRFLTHLDRPADYPEVMVAALIASTGYAVAMADYEGLGDNFSPQPYVHGASLAQQVIDMLRASRTIINETTSPCTWNSQLFLMGYSEGGYVTMTATRELQLNHANEFTVTASAPLSGPHDLSGVMRTLMLSNNTSMAPYFLPFLLTGYNYAYGLQTSIFNPGLTMGSPFNTTLPLLFKGTTQSDEISVAMGMNFSSNPPGIVPKSVLITSFINQLNTDTFTGSAYDFLRRNDSYRVSQNDISIWKPTVPILMLHHIDDELVPYTNSKEAFINFSSVGAKMHISNGPGAKLVPTFTPSLISISALYPTKTVHFGAAFPELSDGWKWIDGFKQ